MDNRYNVPNGYPQQQGYQQGYPQQGGYMPPQPPGNNNSAKIIALIISVTAVLIVGLLAFLIIYLNSHNQGAAPVAATEASYVSTAPEVTVPDLTGMTKERAIKTLSSLNLKAQIVEEETSEQNAGKVFSHVPKEGTPIRKNDEVTLYVAKAKPTEKATEKATQKETKKTESKSDENKSSSVTYLYCTAADYVSLRSGPGVGYTEYIRVPTRDGMVYLGEKSNGWYKVKYGDYTGYVSGNYVSFDKNASINYTPDGGSANRSYKAYSTLYCTASDFVALRSGPGVNYTELARIPHGYTMRYMDSKSGNWYYVYYNGMYGYVSASYVAFQ
ncbi:MAG: SH3 domain-containing protein [Ruminococcus sp.]|nr:SH3 domain-containing protein [Ruminococcus sp.]